MRTVDDLLKFNNYEAIPYRADFTCPECGKSSGNGDGGLVKAPLMGWCETPAGYMMVFECPVCFALFRYHGCSRERNSWDRFRPELELILRLEDC